MKVGLYVFVAVCLLAGIFLRISNLSSRPMHHDEANQAYRFGILLEQGIYQYDAEEHHGPTLYYLTLPIAWLSGHQSFAEISEKTVRSVPVIFGLLLILSTLLLKNGMGRLAVLFAILFTAVSPAMIYYSRFYIQETLLVFFTFLALSSGWKSLKSGNRIWAIICGLSLGLMFSTKETAILAYAAMGGAAMLCAVVDKKWNLPLKSILLGLVCAVLISALLFSAFCTDPFGPWEAIRAFRGYAQRGSGVDTDHVHAWHYYLHMLSFYRIAPGPIWSEGLVLILGLIGSLFIGLKKLPEACDIKLGRFILFYTLLLTLIYSAIPYKTPWCALSFLHGWILLAGIGVASLFNLPKIRWLTLILVVVATGQLLAGGWRSVGRFSADPRNPYVYAHTSTDLLKLIGRIDEISAVNPAGEDMYIQVIADSKQTWPLPFYLRRFNHVGYWENDFLIPKNPVPDLMITSADHISKREGYLTEFYSLRPNVLLSLHIRSELWEHFVETHQ